MPKIDIGTDSADELRDVVGDDAMATFEDDANFVESNPVVHASAGSVAVQRDTDDVEDSEEEEEEDEEELEDDEDFEDEEEEDEDDEEEEDDADEVAASPMLQVDGLRDEEEDQDDGDVAQGVDEDALEADDMDTDTVTEAWPVAALQASTLAARLSI